MSKPHVLGLLPARGGSKGIPGKNLRPLCGRPLLHWAAAALVGARSVSRRICSTDDMAVASAARDAGLEVPWLRPPELAADRTLVVDVIRHALDTLEQTAEPLFSHVVLVQATSPTVTSADIDGALALAIGQDADTVVSGFAAGQRHPATMYTVREDGCVDWLFGSSQRMARRQDLPPVFVRTGLVYVMKAALVRERGTIYGDRILSWPVPEHRALTIDEEADFRLAEYMMKECP